MTRELVEGETQRLLSLWIAERPTSESTQQRPIDGRTAARESFLEAEAKKQLKITAKLQELKAHRETILIQYQDLTTLAEKIYYSVRFGLIDELKQCMENPDAEAIKAILGKNFGKKAQALIHAAVECTQIEEIPLLSYRVTACPEVLALLFQHKASNQSVDSEGLTALDYATQRRSIPRTDEVIAILVAQGVAAPKWLADQKKETNVFFHPLTAAVLSGNMTNLKSLLLLGLDPDFEPEGTQPSGSKRSILTALEIFNLTESR